MIEPLLTPDRLYSRAEVLAKPSPVPKEAGIYAWYFKEIPPQVPHDDCHRHGNMTLLYVGISPKPPSVNGHPTSRQSIRDRVSYHYRGNAEGSTLRLTLGCLLATKIGIQLRRVGSGKRLTFEDGEYVLSQWMADNAFVAWRGDPEPWSAEERLIANLSLPLNLDMNQRHAFHKELSRIRRTAKEQARLAPDSGSPRKEP
jgi:hypothetical protein